MPRSRTSTRAPRPPRLPRFSPTRLSLYILCPRAYSLYYQAGLRWGSFTPGFAVGTSLHRTLQSFHDRGGAGQVPLVELQETLRAHWNAAAFSSAAEAAAELASGEAALERYHALETEPGRETLWTEKTLQHRYDDYILWGRIDRLDRRPDGSLEVIDYKSGRRTTSEEEVRASLALQVYQLLVARENPGVPVYAGIHCVRSGDHAAVKRSDEELNVIEAELGKLVPRILADEQMAATPGWPCRDCAYPRICPPGREWLATHRDLA
jgi:RecB family exonuclease